MKKHKELYAYALNLLAQREYTAKGLLDKLLSREDTVSAEAVLLHLQQKGYQSDLRFSECYVRYRSKAGFGPLHIKMSLKQKGVSDEHIQAGFDEAAVNWFTVIKTLYHKKYKIKPDSKKEESKRQRFLQGRGFDWDLIRAVQG